MFFKCFKCFQGIVRRSGSDNLHLRADLGRKRRRSADDTGVRSEAAFLRRRRGNIPNQKGEREALEHLPIPSVWGGSHDREVAFAQDKADQRWYQAAREGLLLPEERHATAALGAQMQLENWSPESGSARPACAAMKHRRAVAVVI